MVGPKTYTAKDIAQLTGVTRHRLKHYYNSNLLTDIDGRVGVGRRRRFTRKNVIEASLVDLLSRHGYTYVEIHEIMDNVNINDGIPDEKPDVLLVSSRWETWLMNRDEVQFDDMRLDGDWSVHVIRYNALDGCGHAIQSEQSAVEVITPP